LGRWVKGFDPVISLAIDKFLIVEEFLIFYREVFIFSEICQFLPRTNPFKDDIIAEN